MNRGLIILALAPPLQEVRDACRELVAPEVYDQLTERCCAAITKLAEEVGKPRSATWTLLKLHLAYIGDDLALAIAMSAEFDEQESARRPA